MIKARLGEQLDQRVRTLFPFLFVRPLNPNLLSCLGVLVSSGAALAFAQGRLSLAGLLILFGGLFDLVDGVVARHNGRATRFGAFLDSTLDRLVDMVLMLGIVLYFAGRGELGHVLLAGVALMASVLTSYAKARAEVEMSEVRGGILERAERVVILALGALTGLLVPALWVIALGATVTVVQRVAIIHRGLTELDLESLDAEASQAAGEHP